MSNYSPETSVVRGQVDLSSYTNEKHSPGAGILKRTLWYFCNIFFFLNPWNPLSGLKITILKMFGAKIGTGVLIKPSVNIKYPWKLSIANDVWIGENVWIDNLEQVNIASNVCISQGALLLTGSHDYNLSSFDYDGAPITLEEGVWIGAKAVVAKGVTCKSHSILGINSVADQALKPYTVYKGNPAIPVLERRINALEISG